MEILSGVERRRRWRLEEKLRIVAEAEAPGSVFAHVVRRHWQDNRPFCQNLMAAAIKIQKLPPTNLP